MTSVHRSGGDPVVAVGPVTGGRPADRPDAGTDRWFADLGRLTVEDGTTLPALTVAYEQWGRLNARRDNAVLVLHALTGDSHVVGPAGPQQPTPGWWDGLIGPGAPLDTDRLYVLAANVLGGCRGTTGPSSPAPDGRPWGSRFPRITVRDQVAAEVAFADHLGIERFHTVVGGSMGGMRAVEWAVGHPDRVARSVAIATGAAFSGDQIAWSTPQLDAIRLDPEFRGGDYYPGAGPVRGMAVARQIAHATYRSALELDVRFGRDPQPAVDGAAEQFAVQSYLRHHGRKLGRRFDPNSYLVLTEAMNSHDIGRGRGGITAALHRITAELTVAVVDSDRLFPPAQGEVLATAPACRALHVLHSEYGHDGFLIEAGAVADVVRDAVGN
ncbi:homoserine O-acetyltransferase [Nakamurella flava]|uniref:Homoserine O-acetyltransferase n=2 Tax=Nakamurella flava TaxID=2576308 RepID=A0A4U6QQB6_9ACTN|nr:homoserine O-acetyltransferase [Nakamurella flava]